MKKSEILKGRRELKAIAGKTEYLFFTSILISAALICAALVFAVDSFMHLPEVKDAYSSAVPHMSIPVYSGAPDFLKAVMQWLENAFKEVLLRLPSAAVFLVLLFFLVCPVYQGTIRWCAYLIEERRSLSIAAVLFYFTSPRLYFSCVLISFRIFIRKFLSAIAFLLPPIMCVLAGSMLSNEYFAQPSLSAAIIILSLTWLSLALVLYFIFCQKYSAVRYLFALGCFKNIFKASDKITSQSRAPLFTLRLRLCLNLFLALLVVTAPAAAARIISGNCLATRALMAK